MVRKALWSTALAAGFGLLSSIVGLAGVAVFHVSSEPSPLASCSNDGQFGKNFVSGEEEPQVAVSSEGIIAMYHQDRWSNGGAHGIGVATSTDGQTWLQSTMPWSACAPGTPDSLKQYLRASDPWVSFGPDGVAYASAITFNHGVPNWNNAVAVATSADFGTTWGNVQPIQGSVFTTLSAQTDKNSTTADPVHAGTAYTVWDTLILPTDQPDDNPHAAAYTGPAFFSKTTNGGKDWSTGKVIIDTANRQQTIGNIIVVDPKTDTLYDFTDLIVSPNTNKQGVFSNTLLAFVKSTDGGDHWTQPQVIAPFNSLGVVDPLNPSNRLRVGDGLEEVAIDPTNGNLFVVWASSSNFHKNIQQSTGLWDNEILMATSSNGGATWTGPVVIHQLNNGLPTYTPTVAVNHGVVAVTYYDNRNLGSNASVMPTDLFVSFFNEDGTSAGAEQRITQTSFDQLSAPKARGFFLGDYQGLQPSGATGFEAVFVKSNCDAPYTGTDCGPAFFTGDTNPDTNTNPSDVFAAFVSPS